MQGELQQHRRGETRPSFCRSWFWRLAIFLTHPTLPHHLTPLPISSLYPRSPLKLVFTGYCGHTIIEPLPVLEREESGCLYCNCTKAQYRQELHSYVLLLKVWFWSQRQNLVGLKCCLWRVQKVQKALLLLEICKRNEQWILSKSFRAQANIQLKRCPQGKLHLHPFCQAIFSRTVPHYKRDNKVIE